MTGKKANGDGASQSSDSKLPATTSPGAEMDEYKKVFIPARDAMVSKLTALSRNLKGEEAALIEKLVKSANPQKKGREEMESRWIIPTVRIVHGVTREKPDGAEPGDLYTTSGFKLEQPFKITPLYIYQSNRMFPDGGGSKAPVCFAPDSKLGRPFGECVKCTNLPLGHNPTGTITDCDNGICFIVLSQDMKIYRLEFFKTSRKAGVRLDQLAAACDAIWDRWFSVKTLVQTGSGNEWHIFRVSAAGEDTPQYVRDAADILYDLIHAERQVFLRQHYEAVKRGDSAAANVNEQVDMDALNMSDDGEGDDNPDLSSGGI